MVFKGGRCVEVKTVSCGGSGGQVQEHKSFAAEIEQQQKVGGGTVGSAVCVYTSPPKMGGNVEVKLCSSNDLNDAGKCCQGLHLFLVVFHNKYTKSQNNGPKSKNF